MAKDREPNPNPERTPDLPEDLPPNRTDLPGRRRPDDDIERGPGEGGATEKK